MAGDGENVLIILTTMPQDVVWFDLCYLVQREMVTPRKLLSDNLNLLEL